MKLEDFNRIDPKNLGSLPASVKAVLLCIMLVLIVAAGYWFIWSPSLDELNQATDKETTLRDQFIDKKKEAINLPAYRQQMLDIERTFGSLLRQLPNKSQMDGLLTDINQAGLEQGLEFELFKPGQEKTADFYAEMPISIKVTGNYYDLGAFAYSISKLSRIVTLNDLKIEPVNKDNNKDGQLSIEAVAKTFRYLDANEVAPKKTDKKGKRGGQ
jgi:type IV pilus assembly protein PilO